MENQMNNSPQQPQCCVKTCPAVNKGWKSYIGCFGIFFAACAFLMVCFSVVALLGFASISQIWQNNDEEESSESIVSFEKDFISGKRSSENIILVVPVSGIIYSGMEDSPFGGAEGAAANRICSQLRLAAKDSNVKAVVIKIDSPGGEVVAADMIYQAIKNVRAQGKPVVALMESVAASGGYYIAVGCDRIIAHPMTTTGSIGVIVQTYKYYSLFQKIGVESEPYTSGPMKDLLSGTRPTSPAEKQLIQEHVNKVYDHFVNVCAEGRPNLTAKQIKESKIGDGRIFLGTEAKALGMVDQLGYFSDAEKKIASMAGIADDYKVVSLRKRFSLASLFKGQVAANSSNINIKLPGDSNSLSGKLEQGKFYFLPVNR
jgi:protease-4